MLAIDFIGKYGIKCHMSKLNGKYRLFVRYKDIDRYKQGTFNLTPCDTFREAFRQLPTTPVGDYKPPMNKAEYKRKVQLYHKVQRVFNDQMLEDLKTI